MIIVGFDQAPTNIGWAYGTPGSIPKRGVKKVENFGENTARLGQFVRYWAHDFIKEIGASRVYFEQIIIRRVGLNVPILSKQFKTQLSIESAAADLGLVDDVFEVDISDWRREFFSGARPPKNISDQSSWWKEAALVECLRRNWITEDHNTAEACGIWHYGCLHSDRRFRNTQKVQVRRAELEAWKAEAI